MSIIGFSNFIVNNPVYDTSSIIAFKFGEYRLES